MTKPASATILTLTFYIHGEEIDEGYARKLLNQIDETLYHDAYTSDPEYCAITWYDDSYDYE